MHTQPRATTLWLSEVVVVARPKCGLLPARAPPRRLIGALPTDSGRSTALSPEVPIRGPIAGSPGRPRVVHPGGTPGCLGGFAQRAPNGHRGLPPAPEHNEEKMRNPKAVYAKAVAPEILDERIEPGERFGAPNPDTRHALPPGCRRDPDKAFVDSAGVWAGRRWRY